MAFFLDIFGYLSVILRGLVLTAQSLTVGGIAFLLLLARPLAAGLGAGGESLERRSRGLLRWSALAFAAAELVSVAVQCAVLMGTVDIGLGDALGADFAIAGLVLSAAGLLIAWTSRAPATKNVALALGLLAALVLLAQIATSHAMARLDDRAPLAVADVLHMAGAALWIGGIPYFVLALAGNESGEAWRRIGRRFSSMSMAAVGILVAGGLYMGVVYIGSVDAIYGTAYGVMVATKVALLLGLLFLGGMNFLAVERLRRDPATPVPRLRRFAEVEIGVGLTVLFAAASLTSQPPGADLTADRASWSEVVHRLTPEWPLLSSPDRSELAIYRMEAERQAEAQSNPQLPPAYVPGSGIVPPRDAADIAWSEYNHHWAGIAVLLIGLLALAERARIAPWARHWPLIFVALAVFLFFRSDPEVWPLGDIGFLQSLRDPEVVQHRIFVLLIAGFGVFEWRVRTGRICRPGAALVFPLLIAFGGALLLTHQHALSNVKDQLLIEITHVPLALCGITAAWARWLELRLGPPGDRIAAWVWPVAFVLVGVVLLIYRET
ncbi:MAG TPA: CopD family protein [Stellaceae bacterium]|nr:CopD family protein [Stellaceae bacterium]